MMLKGQASIRHIKIFSGALASLAMMGARLPILTFDSVYPLSNGRRHAWMPNDAIDQPATEARWPERATVLTVLIASESASNDTDSWSAFQNSCMNVSSLG
jgi:hypothetical protein